MVNTLSQNWWTLVLRGVAAVLFGIWAFVWPDITFTVLVLLFGAYALWDGVFALIGAFRTQGERRWMLILEVWWVLPWVWSHFFGRARLHLRCSPSLRPGQS